MIQAARRKLSELERSSTNSRQQADQLPLFVDSEPDPALDYLDTLDPDSLSPRQALDALYELKRLRSG